MRGRAARHAEPRIGAAAAPATVVERAAPSRALRLGAAVLEKEGESLRWCAEFHDDTAAMPIARAGDRITIVRADSTTERASGPATVRAIRPGTCAHVTLDTATVRETRDRGGHAYELALDDSVDLMEIPAISHAVPGVSVWRRDARGFARGDADGDGADEIARACTSQEGVHLALWTVRGDEPPVRRAHLYHYLGFDVVPSCTEEETRDDASP